MLLRLAPILAVVLLFSVSALAQPGADRTSPNTVRLNEASPTTEPLKRMRDYFLKTPAFEFTTEFVNNTDLPGMSRSGTTHFVVRHPNSFRIEMKSSAGYYIFISDGNEITVYRPDKQKFARTPARDSIIGSIYRVVGLFSTQARMIDFLWTVDYGRDTDVTALGVEDVGEKKCAHFRVRRFEDIWDVWLEQSDDALPCRLRSSRRDAHDSGAQSYEFGWVAEPSIASDMFAFTPAEGMREVRVSDLQ